MPDLSARRAARLTGWWLMGKGMHHDGSLRFRLGSTLFEWGWRYTPLPAWPMRVAGPDERPLVDPAYQRALDAQEKRP